MRFPIRHFTLDSGTFGASLILRKRSTFHFLRIAKRVAIVWDRKDGK